MLLPAAPQAALLHPVAPGASIDSAGPVVGDSNLAGSTTTRAILCGGRVPSDLNSLIDPALGVTLVQATGINDAGQVAAVGTVNGQTRGFLLAPSAEAVPEPASLALLGLGLAGAAALARRKV